MIRRRLKKYQAEHGSERHQSVVYVRRLRITLVHALSVKASFDSYFITIGFVVVETFAFVDQNVAVGGQYGGVARMLVGYVIYYLLLKMTYRVQKNKD